MTNCMTCGEPYTTPLHFCPQGEPECPGTEQALDAAMARKDAAQEAALYVNRTERALEHALVEAAIVWVDVMGGKLAQRRASFPATFQALCDAVAALRAYREAHHA